MTDKIINNQVNTLEKSSFPLKIKQILVFILRKIKKYKKTSAFFSILIFSSIYLKYKYSNEIKIFYSFYKSYKSIDKSSFNEDSTLNLVNQFENQFNSLSSKIISYIEKQIQSLFSLSSTYDVIFKASEEEKKNRTIEEKEYLWNCLKTKTLLSLLCSISITRTIFFIGQIHFLLIDKLIKSSSNLSSTNTLNSNENNDFLNVLFNELWSFTVKLIEYMMKVFENRLKPLCDSLISIRMKYSKENLIKIIKKMKDSIENLVFFKEDNLYQYDFVTFYLKTIKTKVESMERMSLSKDIVNFEEVNRNQFGYIQFLGIYYDILNTNAFTILLSEQLSNDYEYLYRKIHMNYEKVLHSDEELSCIKIISSLFFVMIEIFQCDYYILKLPFINQEVHDDLYYMFRCIHA